MHDRWHIFPARAGELGLIMQTWLRGYAMAPGRGPSDVYYTAQRDVIASCMEHGRTVVALPAHADAESSERAVLGWACGEGDTLHFAYVKRVYRRAGLGLELAAAACGEDIQAVSHVATPWQARLLRERGITRCDRWPIYRALNEKTTSA